MKSLLSHKANIPASEQTALASAPEHSLIYQAILSKSIPFFRFIFFEWIFKISTQALKGGFGSSIFLSILPGLNKAGSRISILLVAIIILTFLQLSKPSS